MEIFGNYFLNLDAYNQLLLCGGVFRSLVVHVFRVRKDRCKFMEKKQKWNDSQGSCQGQNEINSVDGRCFRSFGSVGRQS